MKILLWLTAIVFGLLSLFAAANWPLLTAPTSLNFLVFSIYGPLGLILFGATLIIIAMFAVYVLSLRASLLMDMRAHGKELEVQRRLADTAETSRYTELRAHLDREAASLRAAIEDTRTALMTRADGLEQALVSALSDTSNTLAACVGEVDDKLDALALPHRPAP